MEFIRIESERMLIRDNCVIHDIAERLARDGDILISRK